MNLSEKGGDLEVHAGEIFAAIGVILTVVGVWLYCWDTVRRDGHAAPILATWIVFFVATTSSAYSLYAKSGPAISLASASSTLIGVVGTLASVFACLASPRVSKKFEPNHWVCFGLAGIGLAVQMRTGDELLATLIFQVVMCVGYWPTMQGLWKSEKGNTEPIGGLVLFLVASVLGCIPPLVSGEYLALWYPGRGAASLALAMWLIARAERRARK